MWLSLLENINTEYHKNHTLPPVLPIVLYNGVENWDAATNVSDMLQDNSFSNISADYYLIDELHPHEGKKDAIAEGILNCVTALIEVERSKDKNNLEEVLRKLSTKLNTKEKLDGFRTFLRFLRRYVGAKFKREVSNEFKNLEEAINMTRDFAAMERTEGKIEGKIEGKVELINAMKNNGKSAEQIADFIGWNINEILPIYNYKVEDSSQRNNNSMLKN